MGTVIYNILHITITKWYWKYSLYLGTCTISGNVMHEFKMVNTWKYFILYSYELLLVASEFYFDE